MTKHIHTELMLQYAKDWAETPYPWERWEFCDKGLWTKLTTHPSWDSHIQFRRKLKTININGFEVPEPYRNRLEVNTRYWIPFITPDRLVKESMWCEDRLDNKYLSLGLIHLTEQAAIVHAKALLSFTQVE